MSAYWCYLPLRNSNLTLAQQQGYRWATATIPLRSGKYNCYVRTRNTHYNFFQLKYQFISSIWHDYLTRISQISQNHTSLSLVCSRPDGKREWNDAFSRDLRDSRETKSCVKREYFYNAFSLPSSIIYIIWWPSCNWLMAIEQLYDGEHTVVCWPSYDISIEFDQGKRIIKTF